MEEKITTYVIDACAFIAYLRNEEGGDKFSKLLKRRENYLFIGCAKKFDFAT